MELNVSAALKQPGESFSARVEQAFAPEQYGGRQILFQSPVSLDFMYSFDGKAFMLSGQLQCTLSSFCAKCNDMFSEELRIPFTERFVKGTVANEEDSYAFDGDTLELSQMAMDNLFLWLPMRSVCKEECKGLCPVCGINLNKAQCDCMKEYSLEKTPLSALGKLLNDDKEV